MLKVLQHKLSALFISEVILGAARGPGRLAEPPEAEARALEDEGLEELPDGRRKLEGTLAAASALRQREQELHRRLPDGAHVDQELVQLGRVAAQRALDARDHLPEQPVVDEVLGGELEAEGEQLGGQRARLCDRLGLGVRRLAEPGRPRHGVGRLLRVARQRHQRLEDPREGLLGAARRLEALAAELPVDAVEDVQARRVAGAGAVRGTPDVGAQAPRQRGHDLLPDVALVPRQAPPAQAGVQCERLQLEGGRGRDAEPRLLADAVVLGRHARRQREQALRHRLHLPRELAHVGPLFPRRCEEQVDGRRPVLQPEVRYRRLDGRRLLCHGQHPQRLDLGRDHEQEPRARGGGPGEVEDLGEGLGRVLGLGGGGGSPGRLLVVLAIVAVAVVAVVIVIVVVIVFQPLLQHAKLLDRLLVQAQGDQPPDQGRHAGFELELRERDLGRGGGQLAQGGQGDAGALNGREQVRVVAVVVIVVGGGRRRPGVPVPGRDGRRGLPVERAGLQGGHGRRARPPERVLGRRLDQLAGAVLCRPPGGRGGSRGGRGLGRLAERLQGGIDDVCRERGLLSHGQAGVGSGRGGFGAFRRRARDRVRPRPGRVRRGGGCIVPRKQQGLEQRRGGGRAGRDGRDCAAHSVGLGEWRIHEEERLLLGRIRNHIMAMRHGRVA